MAGSLIKKRLAFIFAAALTVCTASLAVGCQPAEDKPVVKSGVYVSNQIEGTDPSEYVFCVSRQAKNAEELLSAINGVIKSTDCGSKLSAYIANTNRREFFLGEISIEYPEGEAIDICTSVYSPYQYSGPYGNGVDGLDVYLWVKAANTLGMKPAFYDFQYEYAYGAVRDGKYDVFATAVANTAEIQKDFYVSDVYSTGYQRIISDKNENYTKLDELKGKRIGVIANLPGETIVEEAIAGGALKDSGAVIVPYDTDAEGYAGLEDGGCDVLITDESSAKYLLNG